MAGIDSGVLNSVARVVIVFSSWMISPSLLTLYAWLSPVKTMDMARLPNSSVTTELV